MTKGGVGMNKTSRLQLLSLASIPLIMVLGNSLIIPVLPDLGQALGLGSFRTSLVITLFSIPAGVIIPLAGFLSDQFGRRKVIIPALVIYGLGGLVSGIPPFFSFPAPFAWLLAGRIIQGVGAAGTAPIAMALTGDLFQGQERSQALGIIESANGLGKVVSPILGSAIGLIAWYAALLSFPVFVAPVIVLMLLFTREPEALKTPPGFAGYLASLKNIFARKTAFLFSSFLAGLVVLLALFGVLFFLSEYLESRYHLAGIPRGGALAVPVLFMSATSFLTGFLIKRKVTLMRLFVLAGLALLTVSLYLLSVPALMRTWTFFAFISLAGTGTGLVLPCLNTMVTSSVGPDERGLITSLYGSVRFFGVAAGPPLFGFLMSKGLPPMFRVAAALAAAATLVALFLAKAPDRPKQTSLKSLGDAVPARVMAKLTHVTFPNTREAAGFGKTSLGTVMQRTLSAIRAVHIIQRLRR